MNAPGFPEAVWFGSRCHGWLVQRGVVGLLGLGRRDVADGLQKPAIVEPVDPFQRRELDGLERPPLPTSMDDLGLSTLAEAALPLLLCPTLLLQFDFVLKLAFDRIDHPHD